MPDAQKRKKPPTFQHYPANRAKKLKREWVEQAKIKSRWKAQKRREGVSALRSGGSPPQQDAHRHGHNDGDESPHHLAPGSSKFREERTDTGSEASADDADDAENDIVATLPPPPPPRRQQERNNKKHPTPRDKIDIRDADKNDDKPSLRDLYRQAYAKSSLHTYKSDPLKKGRNIHTRGRGGQRGAAPDNRGRGQPNMKLRMNAMLEKIKQDYT